MDERKSAIPKSEVSKGEECDIIRVEDFFLETG